MNRIVTVLVSALAVGTVMPTARAAIPTFNATLSSVAYSHDYQILDGPPGRHDARGRGLDPLRQPR
jgi:hypothetical protein